MFYPDDEISHIKQPPFSLEAERSVIGGLLVSPERFDPVSEILIADDFFRNEHRLVFSAVASLGLRGQTADIITICDLLSAAGNLEAAGGIGYLADMAKNTPSVSNILAYARVVRERSQLRRLIAAGQRIADSAFEAGEKASTELIDQAQAEIMGLGDGIAVENEITLAPRLKNLVAEWERRADSGGLVGLSTGIEALDKRTSGLNPSDLIIIGGRPSSGKTSLAMNIAENVAVIQRRPVIVFSMEMSAEQLLDRSAASLGRIPYDLIRSGRIFSDQDHSHKVSPTIMRLKESPLFIDDRAALSLPQMRASLRKASKNAPIELVIVDYLQLAKAKAESRVHEVTAISQGLKALAKEFKCPVIALSQLSRKCEERTDKRPINADLRDSGAVEQDADIIWFIYRDEVYNEDSDMKGIAEVICTKQRNGTIGTDYLAANLAQCRFENLSREWTRPERVIPMKRGSGFR